MANHDLDVAISILRRVVSDLSVFSDGRNIPDDTVESLIVSLEFVFRELIVLETIQQLNAEQLIATGIIRSSLSTLRSLRDLRNMYGHDTSSQVQSVSRGLVGRPYFQIPREQLSYLVHNGFSVPQIADCSVCPLGQFVEEWTTMGYQSEHSIVPYQIQSWIK